MGQFIEYQSTQCLICTKDGLRYWPTPTITGNLRTNRRNTTNRDTLPSSILVANCYPTTKPRETRAAE
jgi:hypothetical protein